MRLKRRHLPGSPLHPPLPPPLLKLMANRLFSCSCHTWSCPSTPLLGPSMWPHGHSRPSPSLPGPHCPPYTQDRSFRTRAPPPLPLCKPILPSSAENPLGASSAQSAAQPSLGPQGPIDTSHHSRCSSLLALFTAPFPLRVFSLFKQNSRFVSSKPPTPQFASQVEKKLKAAPSTN